MAQWEAGFGELTQKTHVEQAQWWLNAFWEDEAAAETIWKITQTMIELDVGTLIKFKGKKGEAQEETKMGCDIDEFKSHRFLELLGETLTVVALRKRLAELDIDNNKRLALSEYLLSKFEKTPDSLVNSVQGDNSEQIEEANLLLKSVQKALAKLQEALVEQETALAVVVKQDEEAKEALERSEHQEAVVRDAESKLQAAVDSLKAEEEAYHGKIRMLQVKVEDPASGVVTKNKAKNQIAQLQSEDPLPLRTAKITMEAALRKVKKERMGAELATAASNKEANKAKEARVESEAKTAQVAQDLAETEKKLEEATAFLETVKKSGGGAARGAIWWLERELQEARRFMPKSKGGI